MSLPAALQTALIDHFGAEPRAAVTLSRSATTHAVRCAINEQQYVVKWCAGNNDTHTPDPCTAEAYGLSLLAEAQAVRVPHLVLQSAADGACPAFFVQEWIESAAQTDQQAAGALLGTQLAAQHRRSAPAYGLDHDNYCGPTPQRNGWRDSWVEFYREQRLGAQMSLARQLGRLPAAREQRLERLMTRLDSWLDPQPEPPSLLHGDLWGGNWLVAADDAPVLIDPAVYFGHREAELAMCRLFGGFPQSFFAAYDAAWSPAAGCDERLPLYQLYHLLNHLNLYGESYGRQVDEVLRRYVG